MNENNMKFIDYIKRHKSRFIHSLQCRAFSSPNPKNRANHIVLKDLIFTETWDHIPPLIYSMGYSRAFDGVLICLNVMDYDDGFTVDTHETIMNLYEVEYRAYNRK